MQTPAHNLRLFHSTLLDIFLRFFSRIHLPPAASTNTHLQRVKPPQNKAWWQIHEEFYVR